MTDISKFSRTIVFIIFIIFILSLNSFASNEQTLTDNWTRISVGFFVWSYKLVSLYIGYLIARLGYNLLIKGISGEFKFSANIKGAKADLASVSPGLFFILMGAVIISFCLYKGLDLSSGNEDQPTNNNNISTIAPLPTKLFK